LQHSDEGLKKVIGVRSLTASAINLTVGAGIFGLPAVVAGYLGTSSYLAYGVCTMLLVLVLLCFISLGTRFPTSGGAYVFVERAFGPYVGFLVNSLFWFGFAVMADAAVANLLVDNLSVFFPALLQPIVRVPVIALIFLFIAWMYVIGVKQGIRLIEIVTLAKLLPLLILIVAGCFVINTDNYEWSAMPSVRSLGEVSLILFFAFGGGAETTLSASGEIKDPVRTIPRGLLLGVFFVFVLYLAVHLVAQGVLGADLALYKEAPLVKVAERALGPLGVTLLVAGAAVSCFGLLSGDVLATPRTIFAAARDGLLPKFLSKIHPRYNTPYAAIALYSGIGFISSVFSGFKQLAILASASLLLIYVGVILATIKFRNEKATTNYFVIPGGMTVPILALLATGWFLTNLALNEIVGVSIFLVFFSLVYVGMKFVKK
jgi:amino acid transporter